MIAEPDKPLNRTFRKRTMIELKSAIYDAHGWQRKEGESMSKRIVAIYEITADPRKNVYIATPRTTGEAETIAERWQRNRT